MSPFRTRLHSTWTFRISPCCKGTSQLIPSLMTCRTSGVPFITSPLSLSLPASSIQTVRVTGIAANPGVIQMRGVSLRLSDGSFAQIPLPVIGEKDKQRQHKSRSRLTSELSKTKRLGLEARFPAPVEPPDEQPVSWLECMVVEEQPLLWIKNTSLTHGTVMLYNGESSGKTPISELQLNNSVGRRSELHSRTRLQFQWTSSSSLSKTRLPARRNTSLQRASSVLNRLTSSSGMLPIARYSSGRTRGRPGSQRVGGPRYQSDVSGKSDGKFHTAGFSLSVVRMALSASITA